MSQFLRPVLAKKAAIFLLRSLLERFAVCFMCESVLEADCGFHWEKLFGHFFLKG
jgi:hypothetical protein